MRQKRHDSHKVSVFVSIQQAATIGRPPDHLQSRPRVFLRERANDMIYLSANYETEMEGDNSLEVLFPSLSYTYTTVISHPHPRPLLRLCTSSLFYLQ